MALLRKQDRVPRLRPGRRRWCDRAPAPGRSIESTGVFGSLEIFAQSARGNVRSVARGKRNHETYRAGGERLGCRRRAAR
jgi:hypothetical protein